MNVLLSEPLTIIACDIHNTNQILMLCSPEIVNIILCFALSLQHSNKILALKTSTKGIIHTNILARDNKAHLMFNLPDTDIQHV